jgi:hypothetical protein
MPMNWHTRNDTLDRLCWPSASAGRYARVNRLESQVRAEAMLAHTVEPLGDQRLDEAGLLVRQRMTGAVEHGERSPWIVLEQIPMAGVPHHGVLASGDDKDGAGVRRAPFGAAAEQPVLADPIESGFVDQAKGGDDVLLEPLQRGLRLHDKVVAEHALLIRAERLVRIRRGLQDLVRRKVPNVLPQRTDQREPCHLLRAPAGDGSGIVRSGGMAYEPEWPITDHTVYEREQKVQNVVGTGQGPCRRVPHARKIRVKAPTVEQTAEYRLHGTDHLSVIHAGTVQYQDRSSVAVLDVMYWYAACFVLHSVSLI